MIIKNYCFIYFVNLIDDTNLVYFCFGLLHQTCMLRCRNYVEQAMFRPRIQKPSKSDDEKTTFDAGRYTRANGPRNHMFVRVGKSMDSESDDEEAMKRSGSMQMRGSFVRIGRQMSPLSTIDNAGLQAGRSTSSTPVKRIALVFHIYGDLLAD